MNMVFGEREKARYLTALSSEGFENVEDEDLFRDGVEWIRKLAE